MCFGKQHVWVQVPPLLTTTLCLPMPLSKHPCLPTAAGRHLCRSRTGTATCSWGHSKWWHLPSLKPVQNSEELTWWLLLLWFSVAVLLPCCLLHSSLSVPPTLQTDLYCRCADIGINRPSLIVLRASFIHNKEHPQWVRAKNYEILLEDNKVCLAMLFCPIQQSLIYVLFKIIFPCQA